MTGRTTPAAASPDAKAVPAPRIQCDLILDRAAQVCVVPPAREDGLGLVRDTTVACRDGKIVWAGPAAAAPVTLDPLPGCTRIDAAGFVVTPGLIDPHTHLPAYGSRAAEFDLRLRGAGYLEILAAGGGILNTVKAVAAASDGDLLAATRADLDYMLASGVTTVEAKSGYGLSADAELRLLRLAAAAGAGHAVEVVPTFLGAHAVPPAYGGNPDGYVEDVLERMLPAVSGEHAARFCDVFCEPGVFSVEQARRILVRGLELGLAPKLHADEMASGGGAELAAEMGATSADHLLFASRQGLAAMAQAGTTAVLLPVTVLSLLGGQVDVAHCRRQAALMRESGVEIALGTDYNPGTAPCRSARLALALASRIFGLSCAEAIRGMTRGAALALGMGERLGSVLPGFDADLVVWDAGMYEELPYRLGDNLVRHVIKAGRVVFGEEPARTPRAARKGRVPHE